MRRLTLLLVAWLLLSALPCEAQSQPEALSPYWGWGIRQWEALILAHARWGNLDPDFLAAIIWSESAGNADEVSYAGAVGLMQVMPYELGFTLRPTTAELLDPEVNLSEGVRVLQFALEMAHGDPFRALCLYNGGSTYEHTNEARRYARGVLDLYAMAVLERFGYDYRDVGEWALVFQVQGHSNLAVATVWSPGRATTWQQLQFAEGYPAVATTVYSSIDQYGIHWRVVAGLVPGDW